MRVILVTLCGLATIMTGTGTANARPYPAMTGLSAAADNAAVAGTNPAAVTRFDSRNTRVEILGFFTENTWEGQIGSGPTFRCFP